MLDNLRRSASTITASIMSFKRVFTKLVALSSSVAAIGLLAAMGGASAASLSATFGPSAGVEPTLPFALLPLGTNSSCPSGCFLNSTNTTVDGVSISFSSPAGGGSSGEYVGNPVGVAVSPFGSAGQPTGIYLDAARGTIVGSSFVPGTVTITYPTAQNSLNILWGSVDANGGSPGFQNQLTVTVAGVTYTGYDVAVAALGSTAAANAYELGSNGTAIAAVEITGLTFTSVTFQDQGTGNGFEFVPGAPTATPLPAALPLFAGGLGVIGLLARRRKQKNAAA